MKLQRSKSDSNPQLRRQRLEAEERLPTRSTYSYSSRRSEEALNLGRAEKSKERAARSARFGLQRFGLIILLLALVVSAYNVLTLSSNPKIMAVSPSGNVPLSAHDQAMYSRAAAQLLSSSIWNGNKLTIDSKGISRGLLAKFPQLASANVTIPFLARRPIIYVEPAQPALILIESNGAFALDTNGRAMSQGPNAQALGLSGGLVVTDQSGLPVKLNHQVLPSTDISFIQTVIGELAAKNFHTSSLTLPAAASELDAQIAGQTYFIKFNLENNDPRNQAGTFLATIAQLQSQGVTPSKYVDVRIDGRAYYQ